MNVNHEYASADPEAAWNGELLQCAAGAHQDVVLMIDDAGRVVSLSPAAEQRFGYRRHEIAGQALHRLIEPPGRRDPSSSPLEQLQLDGAAARQRTLQLLARHKDGSRFPIEISFFSLPAADNWRAIGIVRDLAASEPAQEALRVSMLKHELLFESSRDALMLVAPPTWKFCGANKATLQLFGAASAAEFASLGPWNVSPERQPDGSLSSEKAQEMIAIAMRDGSHFFEWLHQRLDGKPFPADVLLTRMSAGEEVFIQASVRDISDRKRMESALAMELETLTWLNRQYEALNDKLTKTQSQLLQSEKLAAVGLLAAGVAHEINNPIGFVNSNLGTLKEYVGDLLAIIDAYEKAEAALPAAASVFGAVNAAKAELDLPYLKGDVVALVAQSCDGLDRVKKIIQSLKDFSRVETKETWQEEDLHRGIESTLNVVWNELKYKCEVRKEYGETPNVECVLPQLNQVFMNLLLNAAQSIDERGVITIRTGRHEDGVRIEIADSGSGIEPQHLPHIFDPFFTTKPVGKGTGLGLSVSHGIVENHHGRIEAISEIGVGTTFRIWLPIRQPDNAAAR